MLGRPFLIGALGFALVLCNILTWTFSTPIYAGPDETVQVGRAAALVRGQAVGRTFGPTNPGTVVTIPAPFGINPVRVQCIQFHPDVSAACISHIESSQKTVSYVTSVGRYPPLYYAIVGLPSLAFVSVKGVYAMRVVGAVVNALLIALGIFAVARWSRRRALFLALVVACTPMTWYLGSVINPSGIEIAAAISFWCCGVILVCEQSREPPIGLVVATFGSGIVFLLARSLSPFWLLLSACALALMGGRGAIADLASSRAVRWSLLLTVPFVAFALVWVVSQHGLDTLGFSIVPANDSGWHLLTSIFGYSEAWAKQMVAFFGTPDSPAPLFTYIVWLAATGLLVGVSLATPGWRHRIVVLGLIAAVVLLPVGISFAQAHQDGVIWQGRYVLPLAVGIPFVAATSLRSPRNFATRRPVLVAFCVLVGAAQIVAYYGALRRYAVGTKGPVFFLPGEWRPPIGSGFWIVVACLSTAGFMLFVHHAVVRATPVRPGAGEAPALPREPQRTRARHARR